MELIEWINIVFSVIGALMFIISFMIEQRTIRLLNIINKSTKWKIATFLTGFFFFGYLANIYAVSTANVPLQSIFNAIVYLFGGFFVLLVVTISFSTYQAIFKAAERDLGIELKLEKK